MKKIFSTLLFSTIALLGFSQSMQIVGTYPDPIVGNFDVKTHTDLYVKNPSTTKTLTVRCSRTTNSLTTGQGTSFCLGTNCYGSSANQSSITGDIIAPGDSILWTIYYEPDSIEGCGTAIFQIFNKQDAGDFVNKTFHFRTTNSPCAVGILDEVKANAVLSSPFPNPTSAAVNFKYELPRLVANAAISVSDMQGRKVLSLPLTDVKGDISIDTESLQSGIYQVVATGEGEILATKKLAVMK